MIRSKSALYEDYPLQGTSLDVPITQVLRLTDESRENYIHELLNALHVYIEADLMAFKNRVTFRQEIADYRALLRKPADAHLLIDDKTSQSNVLGTKSPGSLHTYHSRTQMWKMVTKQGALKDLISTHDDAIVSRIQKLLDPKNQGKAIFRKSGRMTLQVIYAHLQMNYSVGAAFPPFHAKFFADRYLPDKMLLGIMSEFSTYDNAIRSERSLLGKNERVKQGFWLGGPPPFGYRLEGKKLVEEPKESKWVKFIFESYKDKRTTRSIRQELMKNGVLTRRGNVAWSLGSIEKMLTNTHYGGYHIVKLSRTDEQVRVQCPAILPSTLIRQVKVESTLRSRQTRVSESNLKQFYLLRGFLFCASCAARLSGRLFPKQNRSIYYCPRKERNYVTEDVSPPQQCLNRRYLKIDKTDELVWDTVVEVLAKSHRFKDEVKNQVFGSLATHESTQDDLRTLKRTQSRIKKEILDETNSIVSLETDKILKKRNANEISRILENLDAHRLELEESLEKVNNEILRIESKTQWVDWLTKFGDRITELSDFSPQDKQSFLMGILEKIEVSTVNTQEHSLVLYFKVPYVNDKIEWTKGKSGKRKYSIDGGESVLSVEIDTSKKSPSLRA